MQPMAPREAAKSGPALMRARDAVEMELEGRTRDRMAVEQARRRSFLRVFWLLIGPGLLVMLGENDAPSMLSYSATGAQFGIGFFIPFVVLTFGMAFVAQEITVRLGSVTQAGHAELIFRRFGKFWGRFAMGDLLVTNFLTLITEFVGMVAGAGFFGIPAWMAVAAGLALNIVAVAWHRYWSWERVALAAALVNLVFIPIAIASHPNWGMLGHSLFTFSPMPQGGFDSANLTLLLADIGATVTPWMLFFQQGAVQDKGLTPKDLRHGRIDTALGAALATAAGLAAIVATSVLFTHGMNASQYGAAQFAQAMEPYVGHLMAALFAIGIWEAGLVASLTISSSSAYAVGEVTGAPHSLNLSLKRAPTFYVALLGVVALAGAVVLLPGFPLEAVVIVVNVIAVLTMPPAIAFLLLLVNDVDVVGRHRNTLLLNLFGVSVGVLLTLAGILYALTAVVPSLHL